MGGRGNVLFSQGSVANKSHSNFKPFGITVVSRDINMAQPQGYGYPPPVENNPQYPPPQQYGGYPPPQPGYPSAQAGYPPPQQPGFAPAQPGYAAPINQQPGKHLIFFSTFVRFCLSSL